MDNSANKTQQKASDQPFVQTASVQNVVSPSTSDTSPVQQSVVTNRGGIKINLPPQQRDPKVNQDAPSSNVSAQQQNPSSTAQDEVSSPQAASITPQPVSSPRNKEQEPSVHTKAEVDKMTEPEILEEEKVVEKELQEIVAESPDTEKPKIPEEAKQAGLEHAKEDTPMPSSPSGKIVLPMTYDEAEFTRKKYKWKESIAWFAAIIMYHWKKLGQNKKE